MRIFVIMQTAPKLFAFFFLLLSCVSCVEPVNITLKDTAEHLVVDGLISPGTSPLTLRLSVTTPFGTFRQPVQGAQVTLYDEHGNKESYQEAEADPGLYQLYPTLLHVQEGTGYYVEITLSDGRTYRSAMETVPPLLKADSLTFDITTEAITLNTGEIQEKNLVNVYIHTPLPTAKVYLKWTVQEVYSFTDLVCSPFDIAETCYFDKGMTDPQKILLFSNEGTDGQYLHQKQVAASPLFPNYEYLGRHYFNVQQYTLTQEAYRYWQDIEKILSIGSSLFDPPPASVSGNVYNVADQDESVLGYVGAVSIDTLRMFTLPTDIRPFVPIPNYCIGGAFGTQNPNDPPECCFCRQFKVSAAQVPRPAYWGQ